MEKWLDATRLRLETCGWQVCLLIVPISILLTFFAMYDRSYLDSALLVLDDQCTTLHCRYQSALKNPTPTTVTSPILTEPPPLFPGCNIFYGKWVFDDTYPMYNSCHLAEQDFLCHENGRPDRSYQKWRWQPHECSIPRFDARDILARLRGMRIVIVGDSMGRTQWESLNCLLLQAVTDKASVEMVDWPITRKKPHIGTLFKDHNLTIDYYRSPFLVDEGPDVPEGSPAKVVSTLKLTKVDTAIPQNVFDADVLLINTGHWWLYNRIFESGCYFQVEEKLMLGMHLMEGYEKAISTIITWVNDHINFNRTEVFFRSYEPSHWKQPMATLPSLSIPHPISYPRAMILDQAVGQMQTPAMVLNITSLSSYRPDGHVFNWTTHKHMDCDHWCLPGVPDTWNELLYASLLLRGRGVWSAKTQ